MKTYYFRVHVVGGASFKINVSAADLDGAWHGALSQAISLGVLYYTTSLEYLP